MRNKIYDGGFVPVNRTAAVVTGKSDAGQISLPQHLNREHWFTPPPMRKIDLEFRKNPEFKDLTGRKLGRRTVVGLSAKTSNSGKESSFWVLRCACGVYELQRGKAIRNGTAPDQCCWCRYNEQLRNLGNNKMATASESRTWKECPTLNLIAVKEAKPDFTGARFGALLVLGLPFDNRNGFRTWVVRCDCGMHERRSIKSLIKRYAESEKLMCTACTFKAERV